VPSTAASFSWSCDDGLDDKGVFETSDFFGVEVMNRQATTVKTTAEQALTAIRRHVGQTVGVADHVPLDNDQVVTLVARLCAAATKIPGLSVLARDL